MESKRKSLENHREPLCKGMSGKFHVSAKQAQEQIGLDLFQLKDLAERLELEFKQEGSEGKSSFLDK